MNSQQKSTINQNNIYNPLIQNSYENINSVNSFHLHENNSNKLSYQNFKIRPERIISSA